MPGPRDFWAVVAFSVAGVCVVVGGTLLVLHVIDLLDKLQ